MKRKIASLTISLLALGVVVAGVLWAQEKPKGPARIEAGPGHEVRIMNFSLTPGDQAWLGVMITNVDAERAQELKLPGEYGVIVGEVTEDSPAAKAGLAKDDVILEFAGEKIRSAAQFRRLVRETPPGRGVPMLVSRASQTRSVTVTLERHKTVRSFAVPTPTPGVRVPEFDIRVPEFDFVWHGHGARLGISADELTPQLAEYFGVKQGKGILVREVLVGSAAEKAGLKAGDIIVEVDGQEVASVSKLRRALAADPGEKRKVTLTIVRDRRQQTLAVELEPMAGPRPRVRTRVEVFGPDPEEMEQLAQELQEQAGEYQKLAEEWQEDFQEQQHQLQLHMQRLREELQHEREEIKNEMKQVEREIQTQVI